MIQTAIRRVQEKGTVDHDDKALVEHWLASKQNMDLDATTNLRGTWHCEAMLPSAYVLAQNSANVSGHWFNIYKSGFEGLRKIASLVTVSKRCCSSCSPLFQDVHKALQQASTHASKPGHRVLWSGAALLLWVPRRFAETIIQATWDQLSDKFLREMFQKLRSSRNKCSYPSSSTDYPWGQYQNPSKSTPDRASGFQDLLSPGAASFGLCSRQSQIRAVLGRPRFHGLLILGCLWGKNSWA